MFKSRGFTLIELLMVIAIIGVLAAIAIPQFTEYKKRGFDSRAVSDLRNAATAQEAYFVDENTYKTCTDSATCALYLPGFKVSSGIILSMTATDAAGGVPAYFTGMSAHPQGSKNNISSVSARYNWDSRMGGLQ